MSLPTLTLPGSIPAFLISQHTLAGQELYANVQPSQGHQRKRRLTTSRMIKATAALELTSAQMATLDDWYENALLAGQRQFAARLSGVGAPIQWWGCASAAPFSAEPRPADAGVLWLVTWSLVLIGEPSASAPTQSGLSMAIALELDGSAQIIGNSALTLALQMELIVPAPLSLALLLSLDSSGGGGAFSPSAGAGAIVFAGYAPGVFISYASQLVLQFACSDEVTPITVGQLIALPVLASMGSIKRIVATLNVAQASGSLFTIDVKKNGTTIFSTLLTFDNTETTTATAATPYALSSTSLAVDDLLTVLVTQIGSGEAAGLKVGIVGTP